MGLSSSSLFWVADRVALQCAEGDGGSMAALLDDGMDGAEEGKTCWGEGFGVSGPWFCKEDGDGRGCWVGLGREVEQWPEERRDQEREE